jgi:twitching motility protein PilT
MINLRDLLQEMIEKGASDLHLTAGLPPMVRVDGEVLPTDHEALTPEQTQALAYSVLNEEQQKRFETVKELDFSFGVKGMSRFTAMRTSSAGAWGSRFARFLTRSVPSATSASRPSWSSCRRSSRA